MKFFACLFIAISLIGCTTTERISEGHLSYLDSCRIQGFETQKLFSGDYAPLFQPISEFEKPERSNCSVFVAINPDFLQEAFSLDRKYLRYDYPFAQKIRVHWAQNKASPWVGKSIGLHKRDVKDRTFIFAGEEWQGPIFVEMLHHGLWRFGFELHTRDSVQNRIHSEHLFLGLTLGILLLMAAFAFCLGFLLGNKGFLIYGFYLVSSAGLQLTITGFAFHYFFAQDSWLKNSAAMIFIGSTYFLLALYLLLQIEHTRLSKYLLKVATALSAMIAFLAILAYGYGSIMFSVITVPIIGFLILGGLFVTYWKLESVEAGIYGSGCAVYILAANSYPLRDMGIIPHTYLVDWTPLIGLIGEALIFSAAIAYWIGSVYKKKLVSETALVAEKSKNAELSLIARTTQALAHDIRKPLSLIEVTLDLLAAAPSKDDYIRVLDKATVSVMRAKNSVLNMLEDLLVLGRDIQLIIRPIGLTEILVDSLGQEAQLTSEKNIKIFWELDHQTKVNIDARRFERVFLNMFSNAIEAIPSVGFIRIRSKQLNDGWIELKLINNGSGIGKIDLEKVFEAFYTHNKPTGTGLGLSIAQKIVQAHGGSISCKSETSVDCGEPIVEFNMLIPAHTASDNWESALPASLAHLKADKASENSHPEGCSDNPDQDRAQQIQKDIDTLRKISDEWDRYLKIGVLDDDRTYLDGIRNKIFGSEMADFIDLHIHESASGFVEAAKNHNFDWAIIDLDLKQQTNGFEVCEKLKLSHPELPICIHSNRTFEQDISKAHASGATAMLPKPMELGHLTDFLKSTLSRADREITETE